MRKLLPVALLLAALLVLAPLLAMRSEKNLLWLSEWAVSTFTDLRLVIRHPVLRPLQGRMAASEIHLYPDAGDGPPFLSILDFSGDVNAGDLYSGNLDDTSLRAGQVIIYVSDRDQTSDPSPHEWLRLVKWLPERLDIDQFHLVTASEETFIFPLQDVSGRRTGSDAYSLSTRARYEGEPLQLTIDATTLRARGKLSGLTINANVTAEQSDSHVSLRGDLKGDAADFTYDFTLDGDYRQLADFMRGFDASPPLQGALTLHANLTGDTRGFALRNARLELDNLPNYHFDAEGKLDYRFGGENALQLSATGQLASMELLLDWLNLDLSPLGSAHGSASVGGSLQQPRIEQFSLQSQADSGLKVTIGGDFDPLAENARDNAVKISTSGPSISTLEYWTGDLPFEPGPFRATAQLQTTDGPLALENLAVEVGASDGVQFRLTGNIGSLGKDGAKGLKAIARADLALAVNTVESALLRQYIGEWVPAGLPVKGRVQIQGAGDEISITGGALKVGSAETRLHLQPRGGTIEMAREMPLRDLQAKLTLSVKDTSALSPYVGTAVPSLGALDGTAVLVQNGEKFALSEIALALTGPGLVAEGKGTIPDLTRALQSSFHLDYRLDDPGAFAVASGFRPSRGSGTLNLDTHGSESRFAVQARLGDTSIKGEGSLRYQDGHINKISMRFSSPLLHLKDLGLQAEDDGQTAYKPADQLDALEVGSQLERRLQQLPRYETDIRVDLGGLVGENTRINGFQLHLTGLDKRYTLREFSLDYDESRAEARGIIDLNTSPPYASLAVEALAVPMNTLIRDLGIDYPVSGFANLRGGLTARGTSGAELLQNIDGSLAVALENTEIAGAAYDVLATDLLAWFYSGAALEKSTHIDCTMAQFQLTRGVADSDSLYIETSKMLATGKARIDFRGDSLDVTFTPRSKSRSLQIPSSVHIKGPFKDPGVTVSPIAAAFDATAEVISLVPRMARKLFGLEKKAGDIRPCIAGPRPA